MAPVAAGGATARSLLLATIMSKSGVPTTSPATPSPAGGIRDEERVDAAKTADDAPAPVHPPRERKVLVRDAHGLDPYGEPDRVEVGQEPYEVPGPTAAARQPPTEPADPKV